MLREIKFTSYNNYQKNKSLNDKDSSENKTSRKKMKARKSAI